MRKIIVYSLLAFLSLIMTSLLWSNTFLLTIVLLLIAIIMISIGNKKRDLILFVLGGFFGVIAEAIAIANGAWTYTKSDFMGIPLWLFFLWGMAALYLSKIYKGICEYLIHEPA